MVRIHFRIDGFKSSHSTMDHQAVMEFTHLFETYPSDYTFRIVILTHRKAISMLATDSEFMLVTSLR